MDECTALRGRSTGGRATLHALTATPTHDARRTPTTFMASPRPGWLVPTTCACTALVHISTRAWRSGNALYSHRPETTLQLAQRVGSRPPTTPKQSPQPELAVRGAQRHGCEVCRCRRCRGGVGPWGGGRSTTQSHALDDMWPGHRAPRADPTSVDPGPCPLPLERMRLVVPPSLPTHRGRSPRPRAVHEPPGPCFQAPRKRPPSPPPVPRCPRAPSIFVQVWQVAP